MARLLKERDLDQQMWEAGNWALADAEEALAQLEVLHREASNATASTELVDRSASEREARAHTHLVAAEQSMHDARGELHEAHEQRIATKRLHSEARAREEKIARTEKALKLHVHRSRAAIVDWARQKDFGGDMRPELELMAQGGLRRAVEARRQRLSGEREHMSDTESEAI